MKILSKVYSKTALDRIISRDLLGHELVTNGGFDTDINGWSPTLGAAISWINGELEVITDNPASWGGGVSGFSTVVGEQYLVTVDVTSVSASGDAGVYKSDSSSGHVNIEYVDGIVESTHVLFIFTATATTTYLLITAGNNEPLVQTFTFDSASVKKVL